MDMDAFGDNFDQNDVDPAADFLAREQDQLAGLEDELVTVPPPAAVVNYDFGEPTASQVENDSLPPMEIKPVREEPEKIRKWREEQKLRLEQKDAEEEKKKAELRANAKKELEDWYKTHDEQIAKTQATNRSAERALAAEGAAATGGASGAAGGEWERVAALCDFAGGRGGGGGAAAAAAAAAAAPARSPSARDTARMRSVILQLKQAGVSPRRGPALANSA